MSEEHTPRAEEFPSRTERPDASKDAQVVFLRGLRRECLDKAPVVARITLCSDKEIRGKLESFDLHCLIVHTRRRRYLIYKHAIVKICRSTRKRKAQSEAAASAPDVPTAAAATE